MPKRPDRLEGPGDGPGLFFFLSKVHAPWPSRHEPTFLEGKGQLAIWQFGSVSTHLEIATEALVSQATSTSGQKWIHMHGSTGHVIICRLFTWQKRGKKKEKKKSQNKREAPGQMMIDDLFE